MTACPCMESTLRVPMETSKLCTGKCEEEKKSLVFRHKGQQEFAHRERERVFRSWIYFFCQQRRTNGELNTRGVCCTFWAVIKILITLEGWMCVRSYFWLWNCCMFFLTRVFTRHRIKVEDALFIGWQWRVTYYQRWGILRRRRLTQCQDYHSKWDKSRFVMSFNILDGG